MDKKMLLMQLNVEKEYSERQVRQSIGVLRDILDRVEQGLDSGEVRADDGLQGNEWRLYKELSNLEKVNGFLEQLERLEGN